MYGILKFSFPQKNFSVFNFSFSESLKMWVFEWQSTWNMLNVQKNSAHPTDSTIYSIIWVQSVEMAYFLALRIRDGVTRESLAVFYTYHYTVCRVQKRNKNVHRTLATMSAIMLDVLSSAVELTLIEQMTCSQKVWRVDRAGNSLIRPSLICSLCSNQMSDCERLTH